MSPTSIPDTLTARPLPPMTTIDTNNQEIVLVAVAASDSVSRPIPITAPAGYASLMPLQIIADVLDLLMEGCNCFVNSTSTTQPKTDVPSMSGVSGVTASVVADAGGGCIISGNEHPIFCSAASHELSILES